MTEKEYNKQMWIYSILVIISSIMSGITGISWGLEMNSALQWVLIIVGFVLFLFATIKLAMALQLKPRQLIVALLLTVFFFVGSVLYMTTRKPPLPPARV